MPATGIFGKSDRNAARGTGVRRPGMAVAAWILIASEAQATKTIHGGANKDILKAGDPVSMATGEFFFEQALLRLGGPIPVEFSFVYGSGLDSKLAKDGLPSKFRGSHGARLNRSTISGEETALIDLGAGREVKFLLRNNQWEVFAGEPTIWQLQETADFYYLAHPSDKTVRIFRKHPVAGNPTQPAFEELMLDRNGNSLGSEWPSPPTLHGPTRVFDGLGRELRFTYGTVSQIDASQFLTAVEDHTGRRWQLAYDDGADNGNRVTLRSVTDPLAGVWKFTYQATGDHWITEVQRPRGNTPFTQTYNPNPPFNFRGVVDKQTSALNEVWDFNAVSFPAYDERRSSLFTVTNPDASTVQTVHDHAQRVVSSMTDEGGRRVQFHSERQRDRIIRRIDRKGNIEEYDYHEPTGKLAAYRNGLGHEFRRRYGPAQQTFTNPLPGAANQTVSFTFHDLTRLEYPDGTTEEFTYDTRGNVITATDRVGAKTTFTYNPRGQVLSILNATAGTITFTYDAAGNLKTFTDGETGLFTNVFDALHRRTAIQHPGGTTVAFAFDALDRHTAATDERGVRQEFQLDANGNLTTVVTAAGTPAAQTTRLEYDVMDRPSKVTDPANFDTAISYTYWDALKRFIFPDATQASLTFDVRRRPVQLADEAGATHTSDYDDEANLRRATSAAGRNLRPAVDALGYLASVRDGRDGTTTFTRDAMQRVVGITDRLGRRAEFTYDGEGRLTKNSLPVIGSLEINRSALGLPTQIRDNRGEFWKLGYSPMGRLTRVEDPLTNVWTMTYDSRGRLATISHPDGITETYTYDAASNLLQRSFSNGLNLGFTHDPLNRLTATASTPVQLTYDQRSNITNTVMNGRSFGATFDARSRPKTVTYDGQMTVTYTYDVRGLLTAVGNSLNNATVTLAYDSDQLLVRIQRSNGVTTELTRDENGQITRIQHGAKGDLRLTRDSAGQILRVAGDLPIDVAAFLSNETRSLGYDAASQPNAAGFQHDVRGRRLKDPERTYAWDSADRLTSITTGGTVVANEFTALGEVTRESTGAAVKEFYYNYAFSGHPIMAERVDGAYRRFYIYTPDGRLLHSVEVPANTPRFYHFDHAGSTLFLTDGTGAVTDAYGYTPYGRRVRHEGSSDQPFTFNGELGVRELGGGGLFHMRARWYDARTARFLSRDPIWLQVLERPKEANPYAFARQNPMRFADPSGLAAMFVDSTGKRVDPDLLPPGTVVGAVENDGSVKWGVVALHKDNSELRLGVNANPTGNKDLFALDEKAVAELGLPAHVKELLKLPVAKVPANGNQVGRKPPSADPAIPAATALRVEDSTLILSDCENENGECRNVYHRLNLLSNNAAAEAIAARLTPLLIILLLWAVARALVRVARRGPAPGRGSQES